MNSGKAFDWLEKLPVTPNDQFRQSALQRQASLTKPPGALGRLEDIAVQLSAMQNTLEPAVDRVQITIFAADHGIVAENISAFPQSVTREMIQNFAAGGAAINALACALDAHLEIIDLGTADQDETETRSLPEIRCHSLGPGTHNFLYKAAMDNHQLAAAMAIGRENAEYAQETGHQLYIGGEMGIGNTTSATALACALLKTQPSQVVGRGSGLSDQGVMHKADVIEHALALHRAHIAVPREALRRLGGFEIAALVGAYVRCAQLGFPVLIDGFISTVAALAAESICPQSNHWFIYAHQSAEPGHVHVLKALGAHPLIDLGMRLGEGSGAAVAVNLLRMACALHNQMATFSDARVSSKKQSND